MGFDNGRKEVATGGRVNRLQAGQRDTATRVRLALIPLFLACIFFFDTVTDLEIAVPVFYVAVIVMASGALRPRRLIALAAICVFLTLASFVLTSQGDRRAGWINAAIGVSAIVLTTYLVIRQIEAEASAEKAQVELTRVARMTSMAALTTSIAHEVNQPLSAIAASGAAAGRWLEASPPNIERALTALQRISADALRASEVVSRLRGLARNEPPRQSRFDLNEAVIEAVGWARNEMSRRQIALSFDLSATPIEIVADRTQIQQVVANLLLNAVEAMLSAPASIRRLSVSTHAPSPGTVTLAIADTGSGLDDEAQRRLFDPFWTTKPEGVGIGLTICRSIVEAHGGTILARPGVMGGAVFEVTLPAAAGAHL